MLGSILQETISELVEGVEMGVMTYENIFEVNSKRGSLFEYIKSIISNIVEG